MSILSNYYNFNSCINELVIKQFDKNNVIEGKLTLMDALPGDVIIIDANGKVINTIQYQYLDGNGNCIGVNIDLSQCEIEGKWKVRYNKMKDINTTIEVTGDLSIDDLMIYSLIFN